MKLLTFLCFGLLLATVQSEEEDNCSKCGEKSNAACVSATKFKLCFEDKIDNTKEFDCPDGYTCTKDAGICSRSGMPECLKGSTSNCGRWHEDGTFKCVTENSFVLKFDSDEKTGVTHTCPSGTVCSHKSEKFCIKPSETDKASCGKDDSVPLDIRADKFCLTQKSGRYAHPGDKTKRFFIYCHWIEEVGAMKGALVECPQGTEFNAKGQAMCGKSSKSSANGLLSFSKEKAILLAVLFYLIKAPLNLF